jgi:hypothetical protein
VNYNKIITIVFKGLASLLVLAVLLPSAVKLSHAFNHHEHFVCAVDIDHSTHFHQTDIECDFYKFKLNETYYQVAEYYYSSENITFNKADLSYYFFLIAHQQDISHLRGPPSLV